MELGKEGFSDLKTVARTVAERQPEKCEVVKSQQSWWGGTGEEQEGRERRSHLWIPFRMRLYWPRISS